MKGLVSLAVVVAFFVAIPQCFGQDACLSPAQLLEEQQPLQMSLLLMPPTTIASVPVQGRGKGPPGPEEQGGPGCIKTCSDTKKDGRQECKSLSGQARADCRALVEEVHDNCSLCCHSSCNAPTGDCDQFLPDPEFCRE